MRALFFAVVLAGALGSAGCSVAGAAFGATTPRYEHTEWPRSNVELGSRVRVRTRNVGADSASITDVEGRYGGVRDGLLSVTDEDGREHELPIRDIGGLRVRNGSYWKEGLLLGTAADAILVVTVVAVTQGANVSVVTGH
jgi:hypothetical protein